MNGQEVRQTPGLISFWDFREPAGQPRVAQGPQRTALQETGGQVPTIEDGLFGPRAARFGGPNNRVCLSIARPDLGLLDIHGPRAQLTMIAWLKRADEGTTHGCQAVAGVWNEHHLRQYALFLNLRIHESSEQLGAHVSGIGGATEGHKYCMDAAIGATTIPFDRWVCCAITYDGRTARSYLNGQLDRRKGSNPYPYALGIFDGGSNGADFTVGAVTRPDRVDENFQEHGSTIGNHFHGTLGGLAVFNRCLNDKAIHRLCQLESFMDYRKGF